MIKSRYGIIIVVTAFILVGNITGIARLAQARSRDYRAEAAALKLAIQDLNDQYGNDYPRGKEYLAHLSDLDKQLKNPENKDVRAFDGLKREALLANPLLNFSHLLVVQRDERGPKLGLPQNWQGNCSLPRRGFDDRVISLDIHSGEVKTVFKPESPRFVGDIDLHYNGHKFLFSMLDDNNRWQVWEVGIDGQDLHPLTQSDQSDYDNYDGCYLPDGRFVFDSNRVFQGVPCVGGSQWVANLYISDANGENVRRLCFDQDHDWYPAVMPDGRIMYTRWEYSDTPHYFTRVLMTMNPDGTNQMSFYGSNSYWPNSLFYARSIPGSSTRFVGIVSGHHGAARMGELHLFDITRGRAEAEGVIQQIPGYGKKVEARIADQLVRDSWPKFLHPWPLSDHYFIVAMQKDSKSLWGIYLVDIFDNMLLLKELPGQALLEPVPLKARSMPPIIPDRVNPKSRKAQVYLANVYFGNGLKGVPKGTVKNLRVYALHYAYPRMGGHKNVGVEGAWDVHRILGTVPVESDGSAFFEVPANTPVVVQPLDEKGRAVQLMRSWFTAMPGETLSCTGCHEQGNSVVPSRDTIAAKRQADTIKPWYGPSRGFSFKREVQPVLDKYCVGCHDGSDKSIPDLARKDKNGWGNFTPSYLELHRWVRRPGPESDYHLNVPMEYHASTSRLVQMLEKGHHGVRLDNEAWDRLTTWIDLNVPDHGTWKGNRPIAANYEQRRRQEDCAFSGYQDDMEDEVSGFGAAVAFMPPREELMPTNTISLDGWPIPEQQVKKLQRKPAGKIRKTVSLGQGGKLEMVLIPAGRLIVGSANGMRDEMPRRVAQVDKPFWMSISEITLQQYRLFDPTHRNGFIDQQHKDHTTPGYSMEHDDYPVVRISQQEAMAYCRWLSEKTGMSFTLPSEVQWEWACRAGSDKEFSFDGQGDPGRYANLADQSIKLLAVSGVNPRPIARPNAYQDWMPKDGSFNDGQKLVCAVKQYLPNRWGLYDMHGNVWEWTSGYYTPNDNRVCARGGSWRDRPVMARASVRLPFESWQPVFNVGFRVICELDTTVESAKLAERD